MQTKSKAMRNQISHSSILYKGVDKMQYTLLGFGLTLAVLLGIEAIRERV